MDISELNVFQLQKLISAPLTARPGALTSTPLRAPPPDLHYRLVLHVRHDCLLLNYNPATPLINHI